MEKDTRLGKGLSALFGNQDIDLNSEKKEVTETPNESVFLEIEIEKIKHNPLQPREDFDEEKMNELAESIKNNGLIQPVTVRLSDDKTEYILISGERRIRAAKIAGLEKIPAYVITSPAGSKKEMLKLALIENIQRVDLNPMELSDSFQCLMDEFDLTQEQISGEVSKQRSTVANYLRLQNLPAEIKVSLRKNEISEAHARMLLRVEDLKQQMELWRRIINENLSVRKLEELTKKNIKLRKKRNHKKTEEFDPYMQSFKEMLIKFFGAKVSIKPKDKSSGEIIIEYYSSIDIERIMDKIKE